VAFAFFTFSI
jgi:hypothetical protein